MVDKVNELSKRSGVTPAQLALTWIRAHSNTAGCGVIIPIPGATAASRVEENRKVVPLSAEEKEQLDNILKSFNIHGERQILEWSLYFGLKPVDNNVHIVSRIVHLEIDHTTKHCSVPVIGCLQLRANNTSTI